MNEYVPTIMTKDVITISPETTLAEAREIMLQKHIHHLPVLESDKLVGIVSTWDYFKAGKSAAELETMTARDLMTHKVATMDETQHIGAVAEVLMEHLFHAIPIVDDQYNLKGIVTTTDVIRYAYRKEYPENLEKFISENM